MNYYEHHIGDYAAATSHLSLIEDAVYSRMLRRYYLQESPLPADWRMVAKLTGARTEEELEAVRAVLDEFFSLSDDGYRQKRADEVIAAFHGRQGEKAAERENEAERKRRYRERRSELFEQLRLIGIVPAFNTPTDELVRLLSHGTRRGHDGDGTATQSPSTSNQEPKKQEHVRAAPAPSRFAEFWSAYPNKKSKQEAEKSWRKQKLDARADDLIAHVRLMTVSDDGWRRGYVPMGSTYLNQARWEDVPKGAPSATPPAAPSKTLSAIQRLEDMKNGLADTRNHDGLPETPLLGFGPNTGH